MPLVASAAAAAQSLGPNASPAMKIYVARKKEAAEQLARKAAAREADEKADAGVTGDAACLRAGTQQTALASSSHLAFRRRT